MPVWWARRRSPALCAAGVACKLHAEAETTQPNLQVFFEYNGIPRVVEVREESKAAAATKKVRLSLSPLPLLLGSWCAGSSAVDSWGCGRNGVHSSGSRHQEGSCSFPPLAPKGRTLQSRLKRPPLRGHLIFSSA